MSESRPPLSRLLRKVDRSSAAAEARFVAEARALRRQHSYEQAAQAAQRAILVRGGTAVAWRLLGNLLVESQKPAAASEAFRAAFSLDPTDLNALEMLIETAGSFPVSTSAADFALAEALKGRPDKHLEAAEMAVLYDLTTTQHALRSSPIAAAVETVTAGHALANHLPTSGLTMDVPARALAVAQLANRLEESAVATLAGIPSNELPEVTLRRAIRRILLDKRIRQARPVIREYLRARPGDQWAESLLEGRAMPLEWRVHPASRELTAKGYPLPPRRVQRTYDPNRTHGLYLLHNSLPFSSAGYASRTQGILKAMADRGWKIHGVTRPGYPFDIPPTPRDISLLPAFDVVGSVGYHRLTTAPEPMPKHPLSRFIDVYSRRLEFLAQATRPFVLHAASNHWNGLAAARVGRSLGIPVVYEVRGLWELTRLSREPDWLDSEQYRYMSSMEASAAQAADRVLVITQALADELARRGVAEEKISVLPNGVDSARFSPAPPNVELIRDFGLKGRTIIGYIGSLLDYEGLDILLEAANKIRRPRNTFHVVIVGDGIEGERLRRLAREQSQQDFVTFVGKVSPEEAVRWYSVIDIFALPRKGLPVCEMVSPLKPFEIMASGRALVASDVAALSEIVRNGETGMLHRKDDVDSLSGVLERLIDNPELRRQLGDSARRWVSSERDWSHLSSRLSAIYEELGGWLPN